MAIEVSKQAAYGGKLVTEKYKPLLNVQYQDGERAIYSKLASHRADLLTAAHILPQPLALWTSWTTAIAAESKAGQLPPVVVISSNRSRWIAAGIGACTEQLKHVRFSAAHDLNALTDKGKVGQSPPLYAPGRTGPNRNVYIIVHLFEYEQYKKTLGDLGVTVVGWQFHRPRGSPASHLTGFGASRFAAIEFCKELRKASGNRWDYAWLLDDNVVGITSWPGYATFERAMATKPKNLCVGFKAGTSAEEQTEIVKWAAAEVKHGRAIPTALPRLEPKGLVQQASLWNIKELTDSFLNFGPAFINSAEDVSFCKWLDFTSPAPYFFYEGAKVRKEATREDHSDGAEKVKQAKEAYTRWVVNAESAGAVEAATPPPVMVKLHGGTGERLSTFITDWFDGKGGAKQPPVSDVTSDVTKQKAMCQAVEQIVVEACERGFFNKEALTTNLTINGAKAQEVVRVNL
jgi:hypothetical protein